MLFKIISLITKHFLLLYLALNSKLGQLASTGSCLLMHSILVRINGLKYNFWKQNEFSLSRFSDNRDSNY